MKSLGLTARQISLSVGIARSTVGEYLKRAEAAGIAWPLPDAMDDSALEALLFPHEAKPKGKEHLPDFDYIHAELKKKGVTLALLWEEYVADNPGGYRYSHFCYLYRRFKDKLDLSMRQPHKAGEKMFVDYAGQTIPIVNPQTGEIKEAQIFVAVLGASNYTFAEASWDQSLGSWIGSHTRAFSYFGGVTQIVVPDNLKAGITKPCRYEPDVNPTYYDMASHYGTVVIPTRVKRPKDKPKVEVGVQVVTRWILARLRNRTFFSLAELNRAIAELLERLNDKPFAKLEGTRRSLFEALDKPALLPLPALSYEFAEFKTATVNIDYHVEVDRHYYSVPYQLARKSVDVRLTQSTVEVLFKGKRVASHPRSRQRGASTTNPSHMPAHHRAYLEWTPSRIINWAATIGPNCASLVTAIMEAKKHPEQGYRACLGIIRLAKTCGAERLEAASTRALAAGALSYKSVNLILKNNLERMPVSAHPRPAIEHENIRGPQYYR